MSATWRAARLGFISVGILSLIFVAATVVLAVRQDDPFELDGNAVDDPGGGIDWANVYAPQTSVPEEHRRFVVDLSGPNADSIFTQGGSKDVSEIADWRHTTGNVPDKDDLLNAYVAAYSVDGTLTLYFGADRLANNGDAQIGIWFFRNPVELLPDGTFSGAHTSDDTLVLSNFIGGGDTSNIQIYRWNGQADPANPLVLIAEASADGALSVCTEGDLACAYTNPGGEAAPWPFASKSGEVGIFPSVSFFEGGIDISTILGENALGCYSTFLVETRSSQEPTAQLKDLIAGSLELCGLTATLTASEHSKVTDPVTYTLTLENTGLVTLYAQSIQDTVSGELSSQASSAGCGVLAPGAVCQLTVSYTVQPGDPDPLVNTFTAVYQTGSGDVVTTSAEGSTNLFQPSITFANVASAASATAGGQVSYTLTLDNTSSADSPNLSCTISDPMLGIEESVNLPPGGQHVVTASYTVPDAATGTLINSASVRCQVDGFPNILEATSDYAITIIVIPTPTETPEPTQAPSDTPAPPTATFTNTPEPSEEAGPLVDENQPAPSETPTATSPPTEEPEPQSSPEPEVTQEALGEPTGQGCSPGFWQGGRGRWLWNEANDPGWLGMGSNPFTHSTPFNSFFTPYEATEGYTMYNFVRGGGGPWDWRKAARNVVAGYLNASYGMDYPFTPDEIAQMWSEAASGARPFMEVHEILGAANTLGCGID